MSRALVAPLQGTVLEVRSKGAEVASGRAIVVIESMKMQHDVCCDHDCRIDEVMIEVGATVREGQALVTVSAITDRLTTRDSSSVQAHAVRADLDEVRRRHAITSDAHRPEVVDARHRAARRTARENIADLVDQGSFVEYGPLTVAAQRRRRDLAELIERTPADGLVGGLASVNVGIVGPQRSRAVVMSYDYAVLAGTQGQQNHRKKDRLFDVARRLRLPVVLFAEGGGGRPGDTDGLGVSGLDCWAFHDFAELSGLVPLVGITAGYCFAGNAALLGCCDVVIAVKGSNIGMGGPAMIEGGGLGVFAPGEIGPLDVQAANGVVDLVAEDDADAVRLAKKYLSYFQGTIETEPNQDGVRVAADRQVALRDLVPANRVKSYDVRPVLENLFDVDSVLELRRDFGVGMITAFARLDGRPVGVVANNPLHLGGAIDSDGADKAARFLQLCDAFDIPVVTLVDTPGMMVGPAVEETALVRHCSRLFLVGVNVSVPVVSVVLRKSYGLGAQAMMAGGTKAPLACVAWPTGEFGGMGLEGAVRLGYRRELEAISDETERADQFSRLVDRLYEAGKAVSVASHFEIDDVIDPADTKRWILAVLASWTVSSRNGKKRPNVDSW